MRKLIYLLALWAPITSAQCDVELTNVDWDTGAIQIVVHNSNGCGNGNDTTYINHLDIGISNGVDILNEYEFANFPLHSFLDFTENHFNDGNGDYAYSGDTLNFNMADALNANAGSPTILERWNTWYSDGTFCDGGEVFIWQINYSNSPQALNPDWYNPSGAAQDYPDNNPWDNILPIDGLCPCDPVYIYETDTIIEYLTDTIIEYVEWITVDTLYLTDTIEVLEYVYITDTIFVETIVYEYITDTLWTTEYITDTLWLTEYVYITDTVYVDVVVDNYIYITDTITMTEYIIQTEYIDCETGEPCEDNPGIDVCDDNSIFIPNTFTPNNDGVNDIFYAVTDMACWLTWKLQIYNRWGTLVKEMSDPSDYWTGVSYSGHWLCPDGVYTWKLDATGPGSATHLNGHVTIFR